VGVAEPEPQLFAGAAADFENAELLSKGRLRLRFDKVSQGENEYKNQKIDITMDDNLVKVDNQSYVEDDTGDLEDENDDLKGENNGQEDKGG